jgi:hypothetical protein
MQPKSDLRCSVAEQRESPEMADFVAEVRFTSLILHPWSYGLPITVATPWIALLTNSTHTIAGAGDPRRITRSRIDLKSAGILQAANEGSAEPAISARDERNDSQPILNWLDFQPRRCHRSSRARWSAKLARMNPRFFGGKDMKV